jgi:2-polyprenyl-6-methoxyphenol hydroxylase-like FAD-dependent oxidoreductase
LTRTLFVDRTVFVTNEQCSILIVGAGLAGLSAAMFLGVHGVRATVVERHPTTSIYPKARGQFPHTMEALKVAGVDRRMIDAGPTDPGMRIVVGESVTGRVFNEVLIDANPDFTALSPAPWANASQEAAEPILLERARELGADVRFATELREFSQDDDGVTAVLDTGTVRADYLVAADGHRSPIRHALGIGTHGRGELGRSSGVVFEADLGRTGFALYYLQNPALPGSAGVVVSTDTPNRWALSVGHDPDLNEDRWRELIRVATGVPDLEPVLVSGGAASGHTAVRVADRFSHGRVHLIGDAVRVMPPTGGLGGNTAILDGYHLAWKLAMVVRGEAGPRLLDSHDPERRPYADLVVEQQYTAFVQRMRPDLDDGTLAAPVEPVSALFFGYRHLGAMVREPDDDGAVLENPEEPSGRPGSRAPHVWLSDRLSGGERSTVDLFGRWFVLLTASRAWADGAPPEVGVHLETGPWTKTYGITDEGAVLVRPDGFVAWRSVGAGDPDDMRRALDEVLCRD